MILLRRRVKAMAKRAMAIATIAQIALLCFVGISVRQRSSEMSLLRNLALLENNYIKNSRQVTHDSSVFWKFKNFDLSSWEQNQKINLDQVNEKSNKFFRFVPNTTKLCFIPGTDFQKSVENCVCVPNYFGDDCGIPEAAWFSHFHNRPEDQKKLVPRKHPRKLVHAVLINHEFDFFEARIRMLQDVVDVFIVQESNFTTFGSQKDLEVLSKLKDDAWLSDQQHKILYVPMTTFSERSKQSGWYVYSDIRRHVTMKGLELISGLKDDDLFLILDSDELPLPETLLFLKLYDGYTEPIRFGLRWTIFGFFWLKADDSSLISQLPLFLSRLAGPYNEKLLTIHVMCTIGMLKTVYLNNGSLLRKNVYMDNKLKKFVRRYTKEQGHTIKEWTIGSIDHYAGYHCSWCYSPEGIRTKLISAQKDDKPRWGDYPEKTNVKYIQNLIETGGWFDSTHPFIYVVNKGQKFYAPQYMLDNPNKFEFILEKPKKRT